MVESKTVHSPLVTYASMLSLLTFCPPFVIIMVYNGTCWWLSFQNLGLLETKWAAKFIDIWPRPTVMANFEAALQLPLPGKKVEGPISPAVYRPVYKANGMAA
ncbi:7-dehydrocholesterol reductase-like [Rosa sericea]